MEKTTGTYGTCETNETISYFYTDLLYLIRISLLLYGTANHEDPRNSGNLAPKNYSLHHSISHHSPLICYKSLI